MGSDGSKRAGDLTLSGGRRRRRYALGIWLTVVIFVVLVLLLPHV
jgi:predicted nucleic acid-binding Zn ribbon protein